MRENSKPKVLSLFSGCGGLDIGFHMAGYDIIGCVEIEDQFCKTLEANSKRFFSPEVRIFQQDIRLFDPSQFAKSKIECIIGGPPCQPFSAAGRRAGGVPGMQDDKGLLFKSYCKALQVLKPKAFVFENVYGLKGANDGEAWNEIQASFAELGYSITAEIIDAADYGVPQHRERLIIVGTEFGKSFTFPEPTHGPDSSSGLPLVTILDAISDIQPAVDTPEKIGGLYGHLLPLVPEGLNYSFFTKEMGYPEPLFAWRSKFHDFLYKADRNKPSRTLKAQPGKFTGPFHWANRHFTIEELKRIQSIPDDYILTGNQHQQVQQIGNSVPPKMAEVIATSVLEQVLRPRKQLTYPVRDANFTSTFRTRQREISTYYKQKAQSVIQERFGNNEEQPANFTASHSYYVSYDGLFLKKKTSRKPSSVLKQLFKVKMRCRNTKMSIDIASISEDISNNCTNTSISITGLTKYLSKIESIDITAKTSNITEHFNIWDIIQDELVGISQFFSLIDIYGHYANRGDTVAVKTSISSDTTNEVLVDAISYFGCSINCGLFKTKEEVADSLSISIEQLNSVLKDLRELRIDVRTADTHPTIRTKNIICTYPFPMLSERVLFEKHNTL